MAAWPTCSESGNSEVGGTTTWLELRSKCQSAFGCSCAMAIAVRLARSRVAIGRISSDRCPADPHFCHHSRRSCVASACTRNAHIYQQPDWDQPSFPLRHANFPLSLCVVEFDCSFAARTLCYQLSIYNLLPLGLVHLQLSPIDYRCHRMAFRYRPQSLGLSPQPLLFQ